MSDALTQDGDPSCVRSRVRFRRLIVDLPPSSWALFPPSVPKDALKPRKGEGDHEGITWLAGSFGQHFLAFVFVWFAVLLAASYPSRCRCVFQSFSQHVYTFYFLSLKPPRASVGSYLSLKFTCCLLCLFFLPLLPSVDYVFFLCPALTRSVALSHPSLSFFLSVQYPCSISFLSTSMSLSVHLYLSFFLSVLFLSLSVPFYLFFCPSLYIFLSSSISFLSPSISLSVPLS